LYYVYLLESVKDGRYYIGQTRDLELRLTYHNSGRSRYTKGKGPWIIIGHKIYQSRGDANERRNTIKKIKKQKVNKK
jgi:putative endonuclease